MSADRNKYLQLLNDYYDKIYLVTIERSLHDREKHFSKNLAGLNYSVFMGVDGKKLTQQEISAVYNDKVARKLVDDYFEDRFGTRPGRGFKEGEIGCAMSHLAIYRDIVANNYQRALILEDDAMVDTANAHFIPEILREMPDDCELFYWGYRWYDSESFLHRINRLYIEPVKRAIGFKTVNENVRYPKKFRKHIWYAGLHAGTHAYALNREAAAKLLQYNTPITMLADQIFTELANMGKLKCYVAIPRIILNDQSIESSIKIPDK